MTESVRFCDYTIGSSAYDELPRLCAKLGHRVLLLGGVTALEMASPVLDAVLAGSDLQIAGRLHTPVECSAAGIAALAGECTPLGAELILGVGGGKALDTAKGVAELLGLPIITLPTIAATCAATTALSVLYHEDGRHDTIRFFESPPIHCLIHTGILSEAPAKYLRGGMGDALGKFFECHFASRGQVLPHASALARQISVQCHDPILLNGAQAMFDCDQKNDTPALREVVLAIIVTTGLVSLLVEDCYNGAVAHSVCYGLSEIPRVAKNHLHGDLVAYGILVQLVLDGNIEQAMGLCMFLRRIGIPTSLAELDVELDSPELTMVLEEAIVSPDMEVIPYLVDVEILRSAVHLIESI